MACYYDIDDIIMGEEVEKGAKVDLPFWLAHELYYRQAASINAPACFSLKTRKEIQADAACVDLGSRCPYFYELGCKILPMVGDISIGSFLRYSFTSRYKEILSKSHGVSVMTVPKFMARLTKEEHQLFEAARSSMAAYKKWRVGGSRLERASILGRKRKTGIPTSLSAP